MRTLHAEIDECILSSISETKTCPMCHSEYSEKHPLGSVQLVNKINLQRLLSHIIMDDDKKWHCRKCSARLQTVTNYADIIAFDVEPLKRKYIHLTEISKVQSTLHLHEDVFKLFAVVEFKSSNKHFIAHIKRANGIWKTYDDLEKKVIRSRQCTSTPMAIIGVFYKKQSSE